MSKVERPQGYWRIPDLLKDLTREQISSLEIVYTDLLRFNSKLDLIPKKSELDADILHIFDAVRGCQIVLASTQAPAIFDLESGNGLPAAAISILDPSRKVIAVESDQKKADFLRFMFEKLGHRNLSVRVGGIERLEPSSVSCGIKRSPSRVTKNILATRDIFSVGGEFYHLRGSGWVREIAEIPSQICSFWTPRLIQEYDLPIISTRMGVICTKRI